MFTKSLTKLDLASIRKQGHLGTWVLFDIKIVVALSFILIYPKGIVYYEVFFCIVCLMYVDDHVFS